MGTRGPLSPPDLLVDRTVYATRSKQAVVTIPADFQAAAPRWFTTGGTPAMQPVRQGNFVLSLVDGAETFREMYAMLLTANDPTHYVYLLGWFMGARTELIAGVSASEIMTMLRNASNTGVQVRVMLWDQAGTQNNSEVTQINALTHGAAILDNRTLNYGAHHQKVLVIKGAAGLIAFCGGVDINPDRVAATAGNGSPLHDVHCRMMGPAAFDLLTVFTQRWNDHPDHVTLDRMKGVLLGNSEAVPAVHGRHTVQIGRTYPNGSVHGGIARGPTGYSFAPTGEQTVWRMIDHAIGQARRFIYIEDQYLVDMRASRALVAALPNIQHLTIIIPQGAISDLPQVHFRRREFIAPLRAAGGTKVRVFFLAPAGNPHTYVHAKTWIFDDEYAIIGSANCNRRGYSHDSEVVAGIFDPGSVTDLASFFARQLRIRLWAEHLNMGTPADEASLFDGVAAGMYWTSPPPGAHIGVYDETVNIERIHTDYAWNTGEDPDGS